MCVVCVWGECGGGGVFPVNVSTKDTLSTMVSFTIKHIAEQVGGDLDGPGEIEITGVDALDSAGSGDLSFITRGAFIKKWASSQAAAVLVNRDIPADAVEIVAGKAIVWVDSADLAMAMVLEMFAPPVSRPASGIHATAVIDATAKLGERVTVGAWSYVGPDAVVGDDCVIHERVSLAADAVIGSSCELYTGVVIRERCVLGDRVVCHPNVVIGADGFGYRPRPDGQGLMKIPQIGSVEIGDDVEIGAGTCVDRGKFAATRIGNQTKIDNLCQIGHNVTIGQCCVIAGQVGIGGSATVGDFVQLGGQCGLRDHVNVGTGSRLAACSAALSDVPAGVTWGGTPAQDIRETIRGYAMLKRLPNLVKKWGK